LIGFRDPSYPSISLSLSYFIHVFFDYLYQIEDSIEMKSEFAYTHFLLKPKSKAYDILRLLYAKNHLQGIKCLFQFFFCCSCVLVFFSNFILLSTNFCLQNKYVNTFCNLKYALFLLLILLCFFLFSFNLNKKLSLFFFFFLSNEALEMSSYFLDSVWI